MSMSKREAKRIALRTAILLLWQERGNPTDLILTVMSDAGFDPDDYPMGTVLACLEDIEDELQRKLTRIEDSHVG